MFLVVFMEKWKKNHQNLGNFESPTPRRRDLMQQRAWHVQVAAWLRGGLNKPQVRHNVVTFHSMETFVFFLFFLSFPRGLVYWANEDPISV